VSEIRQVRVYFSGSPRSGIKIPLVFNVCHHVRKLRLPLAEIK
jgi:hypothetical protein